MAKRRIYDQDRHAPVAMLSRSRRVSMPYQRMSRNGQGAHTPRSPVNVSALLLCPCW